MGSGLWGAIGHQVPQSFDSSHVIVAMGCKGSKAKVDAPLPGMVKVSHVGV